MQDKTIDNGLRHLHRECMNGRHDALHLVVALMRLRGVEPDLKARSDELGSRRAQRSARLRAGRLAGTPGQP
jgi:hypothetical protein